MDTGVQINLNSILQGVAQLETDNLQQFANEVVQLLLKRTSSDEQIKEWAIIYQIYTLVPAADLVRYNELVTKAEQEEVAIEERKEYIKLSEKMEQLSAKRLELLIALAAIRKVSILEVMQQLGLQKRPHAETIYS